MTSISTSNLFDFKLRSSLLGAVGGAVSGVGGFVGSVVTNVVGGVLEGARRENHPLWKCDDEN